MLNLLGRMADIVGQPLLKARPELLGHSYLDVILGVLELGKEHIGSGIKAPVRNRDGVFEGYFNVTYKPVKDDFGQVTGVMVVASNVTEQRIAQQQTLELNEELTSVNEELKASNEELSSSQDYLLEVNHNLIESELGIPIGPGFPLQSFLKKDFQYNP